MARSLVSSDSEPDAVDFAIEVEDNSADENASISNKSPTMPSSMERSPAAQLPPKFWIELPPLPEDYQDYTWLNVPPLEQSEVEDVSDSDEEDNSSRIPVELVGEIEQDGKEYYYARVKGGIITRFTTRSVQAKYPQLVKTYRRKLKKGTLPEFDPSGTAVHPKHRLPRIRFKPLQKPKRANPSRSSRSSTATYRGEEEDTITISSGSDDEEVVPVRHSARLAGNDREKKPTTRKIRDLRRNNGAGSSASSTSELDSDTSYEVVSGDSGSERERLPTVRLKRARRPRPTIQGLGIIRSIDDDDGSDDNTETSVLRRHRAHCEACGEQPAHKLLALYEKRKGKKQGRGRPKKSADDDQESQPEEERIENLGGWVRCLYCCVAGHWGCLSGAQRQEIQMAAKRHENEVEIADRRAQGFEVADDADLVEKRKQIWLDQTTEFICGLCSKGGRCMICREQTGAHLHAPAMALNGGSTSADAIDLSTPPPEPLVTIQAATPANKDDDALSSPKSVPVRLQPVKPNEVHMRYAPPDALQVLFRCRNCRRPAHWQHLPPRDPSDENQSTAVQIAEVYLERGPDQWKCPDCIRLTYPAERILAWRPDPPDAVETLARGEVPKPKDLLPREYLVKFKERGYRRVEWVPHMWLLAMHEGLLRNFLKNGTRLQLLEDDNEEFLEKIGKAHEDDKGKAKANSTGGALDVLPVFVRSRSASAEVDKKEQPEYEETPGPMPDAQLRIPDSWLRVDRVLDAILRLPMKPEGKMKVKAKKTRIGDSDSDSEGDDSLFVDGEEPPSHLTETVRDFELRKGRKITSEELINRAIWVYFKFEGLQYDECVWDSPPKPGSLEWDSYAKAVPRYVFAQGVEVKTLKREEEKQRDQRQKRDLSYWSRFDLQPKLEDKSLQLMPFQTQGLQWLYGNWWNLQPSILADDMGLGKTVQLVSLIGKLVSDHVYPHLIVVPNSTIVNWVREFERWTPHVRVVRYNGEAKARQVIKKTELWNAYGNQMYHALVTTYETLAGADFHPVFKKPGRWETVVVDEGQRLKSDSSLLFRKLNELKTIHRILMTGTPLNNNIRELFNLMNFLDPENWNNLDELEKEYDQDNLTEELIGRLHERLRPYFLRRQKAEVLDLPDKHEVIVPVSLAPIQKDIMRAILEANIQALGLLVDKNLRETRKGPGPKRSSLHNALMEMRKCIQHPYLNQADMERRGLSQEETLKQLVDASAKLRLLKIMLPQLKKRGHRVLLFSQFKIVLDIIEDFLVMEGYKLLRLDGDTKSSLRQKEIDEFNKPGSDYFIYILTTRAGGVGVNLWSADTVIVFDPDFNPHQDLQAIARAHRYGQKKRVLVFKFMAKDSPEEKIFMMGKKKLVLDHLIVQKLGDDDEMEDIQGIMMYGAKALFENPGESASDIKYTEKDIEELIIRAETEKIEEKKSTEGGMKFDFAQVWDRGQGAKTDIPDINQDTGADDDFWAGVLKRAAEEKEKKRAQELMGRGARKRAIANYNEADFLDDSPGKGSKAQSANAGPAKGGTDDDNEFKPVGEESSSDSEPDGSSSSDGPTSSMIPELGYLSLDPSALAPVPYSHPPLALPNSLIAVPGSSLQPTFMVNGQPTKMKKPRKPKPYVPPATGVPVHLSTFPNPSATPFVSSYSGGDTPPKELGFNYMCPYCNKLHSSRGCEASADIDNLLSTRQAILRPDNEDTDDHKYWALNHIEKKLLAHNFDLTQLPRPAFDPESRPKPKPKQAKPKKPRPLPQDVSMAASTAGPSTSTTVQPRGLVLSSIAGSPTAQDALPQVKPKPRKKPKPAVPAPSQFTSAAGIGPSISAALPAPSTSASYSGPSTSAAPNQAAPRQSVSGQVPAPPPFAKSSASIPAPAPKSTTTFAASTADAFNAAARSSASGISRASLGGQVRPQAPAAYPPAANSLPTARPQPVPRAVSLATPSTAPAVRPSPNVLPNARPQPTPRAVSLATPAAQLPPAPNQTNTPSTASTSSTPVAKRPAGNDADEARKKRKFAQCLICDQRPGHHVHECPNITSIDGLKSSIAKLQALGHAGDSNIIAVLQRMLNKRTAGPKS